MAADSACVGTPQQVFGNPFILQIGEDETVADIKPRIQVRSLYCLLK